MWADVSKVKIIQKKIVCPYLSSVLVVWTMLNVDRRTGIKIIEGFIFLFSKPERFHPLPPVIFIVSFSVHT